MTFRLRPSLGEPLHAHDGGLRVYFGNAFQDSVVFLGFESGGPSGIVPIGTGFLLSMGPTGGPTVGYIITARHVAEVLGEFPFLVRFNRKGEDAVILAADERKWIYHSDEMVDVAALALD
jgi:hypothetical protein